MIFPKENFTGKVQSRGHPDVFTAAVYFRRNTLHPSYRSPQWNGCNGLSVAPLLDDRLPGPVALPSIPRLFSDELNLERRPQQGCLSYDSEKRTVIRIKSYRISSLKDSGVDLQELTF